jgi:hypothetical protein
MLPAFLEACTPAAALMDLSASGGRTNLIREMDAKERTLVQGAYERIARHEFGERDVLALLILLRSHCPNQSALRELADFVAHREKDRGSLQRYVQHVVAYGKALETNTPAELRINAVHTADEFFRSLNAALARFELPALERNTADDVLMGAMSILQDVRLIHESRELGQLGLIRIGKDIWLAGCVVMGTVEARVVFPVLIVANRYCSQVDAQNAGPFPGLVEARCVNGRLRLHVDGQEAA